MARMNLRDQLKKARLLSDKKARQLAHEQRVERKQKGREQIEQEQRQRAEEVQELREQERARTRKEQERLDRERRQREERIAVDRLLADARKPGPGTVKFYFQADDGALPWLELSPREAQEVRAGQLCVVRSGPLGTHVYRLLPADATRRVAALRPDAIAFAPEGVLARN
ncbi:MAG TPA: DUF2058 family protein [bacterium]|nr:DUF2058 family protein [bacterium]